MVERFRFVDRNALPIIGFHLLTLRLIVWNFYNDLLWLVLRKWARFTCFIRVRLMSVKYLPNLTFFYYCCYSTPSEG